MCSPTKSNDISYEFNTNGFYTALSDQLQQNQNILQTISLNASKRLQTKRMEFKQIIISSKPDRENDKNQTINSSESHKHRDGQIKSVNSTMQIVKFEEDNAKSEFMNEEIEEKDWSKLQLSKLYIRDSSNQPNAQKKQIQPKISPIESFINTDFFNHDIKDIDQVEKQDNNDKELSMTQKEIMTQCTGDEIVDSLL
eukprot:UN12294